MRAWALARAPEVGDWALQVGSAPELGLMGVRVQRQAARSRPLGLGPALERERGLAHWRPAAQALVSRLGRRWVRQEREQGRLRERPGEGCPGLRRQLSPAGVDGFEPWRSSCRRLAPPRADCPGGRGRPAERGASGWRAALSPPGSAARGRRDPGPPHWAELQARVRVPRQLGPERRVPGLVPGRLGLERA